MILGIMESQPPRTEENFNGRVGKVIFSCPSFVGENHQEVGCRRSERRALIGWRGGSQKGPGWLLCVCVQDLDLVPFLRRRFRFHKAGDAFIVLPYCKGMHRLLCNHVLIIVKWPSHVLQSTYEGSQSGRWSNALRFICAQLNSPFAVT